MAGNEGLKAAEKLKIINRVLEIMDMGALSPDEHNKQMVISAVQITFNLFDVMSEEDRNKVFAVGYKGNQNFYARSEKSRILGASKWEKDLYYNEQGEKDNLG